MRCMFAVICEFRPFFRGDLFFPGRVHRIFVNIHSKSFPGSPKRPLTRKIGFHQKLLFHLIFIESSDIGCHVLILVDLQYVCHANLLLMTAVTPCHAC